jgi:hypothetical protein
LSNRIDAWHAGFSRHVPQAKNAAVEAAGIDPRFHRRDIYGITAA